MKLLIIIPAHNEAENIVAVVENLLQKTPYDYVIVNDGSEDDTGKIARGRGYNLLDLPVNLGLAGAFQRGLRYRKKYGYDRAMQFDADGQHLPEYIDSMVECMEQTGADIVVGSRFVTKPKPKTLRTFGSYLIRLAMYITTGKKLTDPTSGMRLFNRKMIEEFSLDANYAPEPDTISYLMKNGADVREVQVEMGQRTKGESYLDNPVNSAGYMLKMFVSIILIQWFRVRK